MIRIEPTDIHGSRSYFTAFDPEIAARSDISELKVKTERRLKLLLLIKSKIVCAASHLISPLPHSILKECPRLLQEAHIIPALRSDKMHFADVVRPPTDRETKNRTSFFDANVKEVVNWDLGENSGWFRQRFLEELQDENSLIRRGLRDVSSRAIGKLISYIEGTHLLRRHEVSIASKELPTSAQTTLFNFRELLYHISGARVVHCESSLPQENYIDYDLADLEQKRSRLSDEQILWKLVVELTLDSLQPRLLPAALLDLLTFDDIIELRKPIQESGFQEDYDRLIRLAVDSIREDDSSDLFDVEQLESIRARLESSFRQVFEKEIPSFLRSKALSDTTCLLGTGFSLALNAAGLMTGIPAAISAISLLKDSPAFFVNIGKVVENAKSVSLIEQHVRRKNQAIRRLARRVPIRDETVFLDFVELLTAAIAQRVQL